MVIKDSKRVGDYYALKAKKEGYPARSVYKLEEFQVKHRLFKPGQKVLDLGCAPGSWSLYASQIVGPMGRVIGLDLLDPTIKGTGNLSFHKVDILESDPQLFLEFGPFDIVLSDMAPETTGVKDVDRYKSLNLAEAAFHWAQILLKDGGTFLCKIFQGHDCEEFFKGSLAPSFVKMLRLKPQASRKTSVEIFGLGLGFKKSQVKLP